MSVSYFVVFVISSLNFPGHIPGQPCVHHSDFWFLSWSLCFSLTPGRITNSDSSLNRSSHWLSCVDPKRTVLTGWGIQLLSLELIMVIICTSVSEISVWSRNIVLISNESLPEISTHLIFWSHFREGLKGMDMSDLWLSSLPFWGREYSRWSETAAIAFGYLPELLVPMLTWIWIRQAFSLFWRTYFVCFTTSMDEQLSLMLLQ